MNIYTISKKSENKIVLLGKEETRVFLTRLNNAMYSFNFADFFYTILDFKLHEKPKVVDFLNQANDIINASGISEHIIKKVTPYDSKCILCSIGKTVRGYEIISSIKDCENIEFNTKTALYFEIINGELYDFGFCNGFLSKREAKQLY